MRLWDLEDVGVGGGVIVTEAVPLRYVALAVAVVGEAVFEGDCDGGTEKDTELDSPVFVTCPEADSGSDTVSDGGGVSVGYAEKLCCASLSVPDVSELLTLVKDSTFEVVSPRLRVPE